MSRAPLKQGTKIMWKTIEATVIFDNGGESLYVDTNGSKQVWIWDSFDDCCEVVTRHTSKIFCAKEVEELVIKATQEYMELNIKENLVDFLMDEGVIK